MMKLMHLKSMSVVVLLATLVACSGGDDGLGKDEPVLQPSVGLTAGEATATTLSFTVVPQNATDCAYLCIEQGTTVPSAESVLATGKNVNAKGSTSVTVDGLEASTTYQIVAAARGEETTAVNTLKMTTGEAPRTSSSHTLIFYLMGDDTGLESEMDANVQRVLTSAINNQLISDDNHIAIFYDRGNYCRLTEITKVDGRTKQVTIEEYAVSQSSVDPTFMANVLAKVREEVPADSYGIVLSSHGGGWVPVTIYDSYLAEAQTRFIGQDGDDYMEIAQLAMGLSGMHFDYILFDACFMASVEALYDLRNATDYIVASPAEVLGKGFPYTDILPLLFADGHDLEGVCKAFMETYGDSSGTISLVRCSELENLADSMKKLLTAATGKTVDIANIQGYEGFSPHLYFDLEQYAEALTSDSALLNEFKSTLQKVVLYKDYTKTFYSSVGVNKGYVNLPYSCGLTCHIGENQHPATHAAFLETNWAKAVGAK
ncbi:MAG: clostripain-related cysteine peptidase [Bacteroides sp.]|nr:clostripain-related cysteine peptidase [Bacteroides sp.]